MLGQDVVGFLVTTQCLVGFGQLVGVPFDVGQEVELIHLRPDQRLLQIIDGQQMIASGGRERGDIVQGMVTLMLPRLRLHDRDGEHLSGEVLGLVMAALEITGSGQVAQTALEARMKVAEARLLAPQVGQGQFVDPRIVLLAPAEGDETAAGQLQLRAGIPVSLRDHLQAALELRIGLGGLVLGSQHLRPGGDVQGLQALGLLPVVMIALLATGSLHGDLRNLGGTASK